MCPKCGKALFISADMYTANAEFKQCITCGYEESILPTPSLVAEELKGGNWMPEVLQKATKNGKSFGGVTGKKEKK